MGEGGTGGASDIVKMQSSGEDPMETHRLSWVAGRKRRALASYFSVRIWYVFFISECGEELYLDLSETM